MTDRLFPFRTAAFSALYCKLCNILGMLYVKAFNFFLVFHCLEFVSSNERISSTCPLYRHVLVIFSAMSYFVLCRFWCCLLAVFLICLFTLMCIELFAATDVWMPVSLFVHNEHVGGEFCLLSCLLRGRVLWRTKLHLQSHPGFHFTVCCVTISGVDRDAWGRLAPKNSSNPLHLMSFSTSIMQSILCGLILGFQNALNPLSAGLPQTPLEKLTAPPDS